MAAPRVLLATPAIRWGLDPLSWKILPRIHIGPLAISPHGVGIAVGFLVGAQLMVRRARKYGGPDEADIWNALFYGLIGAIVGARVGYVLGHLSQVTNHGHHLVGIFEVWQGGISLIGGIFGGILAALPYARRHRMGFWRTMDLVAPNLAIGIVIGRIGDLIIGDHLGKPTSLPFGWHCLGSDPGSAPPIPASIYRQALAQGHPPSLGCYNITLHQTALYDFVSTIFLAALLLWLGRRPHRPGFMIIVFTIWYGTGRLITDFLRVDRRYFGLTGSQISVSIVGLICVYLLVRYRGAPPQWADPPGSEAGPDAGGPSGEGTEVASDAESERSAP
ncbi:MAG: phosphatidylglycerol---prolipoprotein diacylglyceryl transferase [Actinomycetota bacterium]|nr:phosphatidylglycerol---prolipoprotein diacylglyceryl transferase [Actinomycetota bacterium]